MTNLRGETAGPLPSAALVVLLLTACGAGEPPRALTAPPAVPRTAAPRETSTTVPASTTRESTALTPEQKRRAEQLVNLFEYDTIEITYDMVEALDDGRGITAGRAGFTTATGDLLDAVERYTARSPGTPLAPFLPRLRELALAESGDTSGLDGFAAAWIESARDPAFRDVQDEVVDETYYGPAMAIAAKAGLLLPVSRAVVFDTIIQHGGGEDPDGLPALIETTRARRRGVPAEGLDEVPWILEFLAVRRADLEFAHNPETRPAWQQSTNRVDILRRIVESGNLELEGPIEVVGPGHFATIP